MEFKFSNINQAFRELVEGIYTGRISIVRQPGGVGNILCIPEPVLICYNRPWERVLFNQVKDTNPFFHLFESLWMLAGRNDVETLEKYNSKIGEIASDDGKTFNGAYGYRWRKSKGPMVPYKNHTFWRHGKDQIELIIEHLKANPNSRRAVLQMWSVEDDLLKINESKDVCCNLSVMFSIRTEIGDIQNPRQYLDMTVTNRSNDLIWGMLGANVVHFSFLQEYIAVRLGINMGRYYHFTNNLHVYESNWNPNEWLSVYENRTQHSPPIDYNDRMRTRIPIGNDFFDDELREFVDTLLESSTALVSWKNQFFHMVAWPMKLAFDAHKSRNYDLALDYCKAIMAEDWREVCTQWIKKRQVNWQQKTNNMGMGA